MLVKAEDSDAQAKALDTQASAAAAGKCRANYCRGQQYWRARRRPPLICDVSQNLISARLVSFRLVPFRFIVRAAPLRDARENTLPPFLISSHLIPSRLILLAQTARRLPVRASDISPRRLNRCPSRRRKCRRRRCRCRLHVDTGLRLA